jgi:succinyl-diaminopimelate desuccinylase
VLLVGHLDVVPPTDDDRHPRVETRDGQELVVARGASDMKAGNVIAMAAFEDAELRASSPYDLVLLLYAGEEGSADANELRDVLAEVTWLREASLAIVSNRPTARSSSAASAGCTRCSPSAGQQAHSARPWHGRNALTMAGAFLDELDRDHVREVDVDGIVYRDVWSATQAWTDGLGPGPRPAERPGPQRHPRHLPRQPQPPVRALPRPRRRRGGGPRAGRDRAEVEIVDRSPPAPPRLDEPVVRPSSARVEAPVAGKQAWTDVARFAEVGVPALNYGPGLTGQAHQRGEYVRVDDVRGRSRPPGPLPHPHVPSPPDAPGSSISTTAEPDEVVVVIDVLRAFTTVPWCPRAGAREVLAVDTPPRPSRCATSSSPTRPGRVVLAGEDGGRASRGSTSATPPPRSPAPTSTVPRSSTAPRRGPRASPGASAAAGCSPPRSSTPPPPSRRASHGAEQVTFVVTGASLGRDGDEDLACAELLAARLRGADPDPQPFLDRVATSDAGRAFATGGPRLGAAVGPRSRARARPLRPAAARRPGRPSRPVRPGRDTCPRPSGLNRARRRTPPAAVRGRRDRRPHAPYRGGRTTEGGRVRERPTTSAPPATEGLAARIELALDAVAHPEEVRGSGCLLLDGSSALRAVASAGPGAEALSLAEELCHEGPCHDALDGFGVEVADVRAERRWTRLDVLIEASPLRSVVSLPVTHEGEPVGAVYAFTAHHTELTSASYEALRTAVTQVEVLVADALAAPAVTDDEIVAGLRAALRHGPLLRDAARHLPATSNGLVRFHRMSAATGLSPVEVATRIVAEGRAPDPAVLAVHASRHVRTVRSSRASPSPTP